MKRYLMVLGDPFEKGLQLISKENGRYFKSLEEILNIAEHLGIVGDIWLAEVKDISSNAACSISTSRIKKGKK